MTSNAESLRAVRAALDRHGLLLEVDAKRPSVTTIVAGEPVRGSWWGHPAGKRIYDVLGSLTDAEALSVPLVDGKATLLHPRLWPAFVAVATSGEAWQTQGLSAAGRTLLAALSEHDSLRADQPPRGLAMPAKELGSLFRDLERRLLVHGGSVHTESGAHAAVIRPWGQFAAHAAIARPLPSAAEGRATLETAIKHWAAESKPPPRLPWSPRRGT